MKGGSFIIKVEKVRAGSTVPVGMSSPPIRDRAVIGRAASTDFRLTDPTVAGEHLLLETTREGFSMRVLTERGTTFLNRERAKFHQLVKVKEDRAWLQLGRVLLSVTQVQATLPFDDQLSIPAESMLTQTQSWLTVRVQPEPKVWVRGQLVPLFPSAARALALLCAKPGQVVSSQELKRAMNPGGHHLAGGTNLNQAVTYIRNMFLRALKDGILDEATLHRQVTRAKGVPPLIGSVKDTRELMRVLIESERGVGYRIRLSPADIAPVALP